jgi:hypothetical protein
MADTLRGWLRGEILGVLNRHTVPPPLILWCDPDNAWRDLLRAAAEGDAFELWSGGEHELVLRERLIDAPPRPRVLWLPVCRENIGYLKPFELDAEMVWTETLITALVRFGVEIPRDQEAELRDLLPAHAVEWIDRPRTSWRELTPGTAQSTLVDEAQILLALARRGTPLGTIIGPDRMPVFARRLRDHYGLTAPDGRTDDDWRAAAVAQLLVTDAAERVPYDPPQDPERIISPGAQREAAMKLLGRWQRDIELMGGFESNADEADALTSLVYWARSLSSPAPPLASRAAEDALFQQEAEYLARLEQFEPLAARLVERQQWYTDHARGFWGRRAEHKVPWLAMATLSQAAEVLRQQAGVARGWNNPQDAVEWFTASGWQLDWQGEILFRDDPKLPGSLLEVRARLRRAYQRHLDGINSAFSELLSRHGIGSITIPFAGEVLAQRLAVKETAAVLVLDACRYDLGARLAAMLDEGEPARRAEMIPARAPLPSITALGMVFALAEDPTALSVDLTPEAPRRWRVSEQAGPDLASPEVRRDWLRRRFRLKSAAIQQAESLLESAPPTPKDAGRLLFVFGADFDRQGHEGELELSGADDYLERYVRIVRRLRDAGYSTIAVVTDHGFLHWDPDPDEVDDPPSGEILWRSRRAVAGHEIIHRTAISVPVPGSALKCLVPRSVNAFRTYGKIGFFHGGATLQELIIPVVLFRWPKKTEKVPAVLAPLSEITSLRPRIEIRPGTAGRLPGIGAGASTVSRQVIVKVIDPRTGRRLFHWLQGANVQPEASAITVTLERVPGESCPRGTKLRIELRDADNEELLDWCDVELKIDLEEWD